MLHNNRLTPRSLKYTGFSSNIYINTDSSTRQYHYTFYYYKSMLYFTLIYKRTTHFLRLKIYVLRNKNPINKFQTTLALYVFLFPICHRILHTLNIKITDFTNARSPTLTSIAAYNLPPYPCNP